MMDNHLSWSRSQMEGFVVKPLYVYLRDLIVTKLQNADNQISDKQISVDILVDQHEQARADRLMLRIIIRNLLANAIKFTPVGGNNIFSTITEMESVSMAIKESWVGISADNLG